MSQKERDYMQHTLTKPEPLIATNKTILTFFGIREKMKEDKQTIIRLKNIDWTWKLIGEAVNQKPDTCKKVYQRYRLIKDLPPKTIISRSKITAPIGLKIKQETRDNPRVSVRKLVTIINDGIDEEKAKISWSFC